MCDSLVACQIEDHVATIRIAAAPKNHQEAAVNQSYQFANICSEIASDAEVTVIILTGDQDGDFLKASALICDILNSDLTINRRLWMLSESIADIIIPSIAAINGDAIGIGLELTLACDLRICTETTHFAMNHIMYGGIPWDGGTQRLSRLVGRGKAMEMILTGETIDAQEAYSIGLVHRVVPDDEILTVAMDMAREIATKSPIAVKYAIEAINKGMDLSLEQGLRLEADLYFLLHTTRDRTEGIRAFQEKRSPRFEGR